MLKAIFPFFPISSLTLICCFRSFDVVSNFLVATSINPHVFRHIIVYNSFSRACALFSILIVISYSFSSFTSSLLISYFLFSEFFFLFSALFSSKDIRFFSSSCSFYSLSQEKISESHHMRNAWVLPSTSHSTWNCNKTHCKEGVGEEISTHTFPIVWVLFSNPIPIICYTSSYGKYMGFPLITHIMRKGSKTHFMGRNWKLGNWCSYFSHCMGAFFPCDSHPMVYFIMGKG